MTDMKETSLAAITRGTDANYGVQAGGEKVSGNLGSVAKAQCVVEEDQLKFAAVAEQDNSDPFVSDEELRSKGITVRTVAESNGATVSNTQSEAVSKPVAEHKGITIAPASSMTSMIEEAIRGKSVEPVISNAGTANTFTDSVGAFDNATINAGAMLTQIQDNAPEAEKASVEKKMRELDDLLGSSDDTVYGALTGVGKPKTRKSKPSKKDKLRRIAELVDSDTYEKIKGILDEDTSVHIEGAGVYRWTRLSADNHAMLESVAERFAGINKGTLLGLIIYNAVNDRIEDGDMFLRTPVSLIVDGSTSQTDKKTAYEVSPLMYSNLNNSKYCCGLPLEALINSMVRNFLIGLPECNFDLNYIFDYCRYTKPSVAYKSLAYEKFITASVLIPEQRKSTFRLRDERSDVDINVTVRKNLGANNSGYCLYLEDMPVFSFKDASMLSSICVYSHVSGDINYLAIHLVSNSKQRALYGFIHDKNLYIWNPSRGWQGTCLC